MDNELWRWVWVAVAMVMGLGEIFTAGFFLAPFAIGGVLAAVAAWLDFPGGVQWLLFFAGTGASMLVLRRFMGRQDSPDDLPVGSYRYVGMEARVIEDIDLVENTGRVRVESDEWRAVTDTGPVKEGSLVRVIAVRGTKLLVEFVESPPHDYVPHGAAPAPAPAPASVAEAASEGDASDAGAVEGAQDDDTQSPRSE
ncbi:NfeD family protein [Candidatus Poriferisodalis sp.]|uniref:NfeD family protein n=1 Tax=Candidatus Poriferisodalis sp. TaxID=3101277 RepID=UPI003B0102D9